MELKRLEVIFTDLLDRGFIKKLIKRHKLLLLLFNLIKAALKETIFWIK